VFDQTAALVAAGLEAQFACVSGSLLAERLLPLGWVRPLITHPRTPVNLLGAASRLRETIRRAKLHLLHAHAPHDHAIALLAARGTSAMVARTFHHVRYARGNPATRFLLRGTKAFAFSNRAIGEEFGEPGTVLPPVVDTERFRPGPGWDETWRQFGVHPGALAAGTVGKMAAGRGHEEAIRAAARVPGLASVHIGHGERMPELKRLAESVGAGGRNVFVGYQEDALPDLYRSWDIFLFP